MSPRVLFVGHEATRSGAPRMLLWLLEWLRAQTQCDCELVLRRAGPLTPAYARYANVYLLRDRGLSGLAAGALDSRRYDLDVVGAFTATSLARHFATRDVQLLYSNTITNAIFLSELGLRCPVICHAHEVSASLASLDAETLRLVPRVASAFLAVTEGMAKSLSGLGVRRDQVTVVPGWVPANRLYAGRAAARQAFRAQHRLSEDAVLIGGCGSLEPRKGSPRLITIAAEAIARAPGTPLHFAWLGGDAAAVQALQRSIADAGLADRMWAWPAVDDPAPYFAALDIFALTSSDDPFPLVVLEAGAAEHPSIVFAGNGEIVTADTGVVVPTADASAFARAIVDLAIDRNRRRQLGQAMATCVREQYDVEVIAPRIARLIAERARPS